MTEQGRRLYKWTSDKKNEEFNNAVRETLDRVERAIRADRDYMFTPRTGTSTMYEEGVGSQDAPQDISDSPPEGIPEVPGSPIRVEELYRGRHEGFPPVGSRVRMTGFRSHYEVNNFLTSLVNNGRAIGTVCRHNNTTVSVNFDEFMDGHDAGGSAEEGHGWDVNIRNLVVIPTTNYGVEEDDE